ncbi:MAG TPA: hypothetical protein VJ937_11885, partial [Salinivirga sp.]|uniref:hypothetical protein n=1 Tax=Salinivirga sp. TaxID=1970192 RepID=UPI002B4A2C1B
SSLDSAMVVQLLSIIEKLDTTLIIVSQALLPLISCCDRIAVLAGGEIIGCGKKKEILKDENLMREGGVDIDFYRRMYKEYLE